MGEVCSVGTGKSDRVHASEQGEFPFFVRSQVVLRSESFEFDEEAVIIPGEGGVGDIFHHVNGKYALHQRAYRVAPVQDLLCARFLYFYLKSNFGAYIQNRAVSATVTSIRKPMLTEMPIPLPSIEAQGRIVEILDKFEALVNDISVGLPAELEARRKQYEYYRDKLLTFPEVSA